ncbi:MAG: hypothetical protein PHR56_05555 [Dehalococcoidales bacterium]|nr:hypothetical protein [Dehalococcoidales bacterium]
MITTPVVQTARGAVETASLGFTLMHEHVLMRSPGVLENWPHLWDIEAETERAIRTLNEAKQAGVDTIVDATTIDLGRDISRLKRIAEKVRLNIIVATGIHIRPPVYFKRADYNADRFAELFVHDIEVGIAGTGIRAGVIKVATEPVLEPINEAIIRGAARAHRRTGAPLFTHTSVGNRTAVTQQDIFADEGVDLKRTVIGHAGDCEDIPFLEKLIRRGSYIGMDRFGFSDYPPDDKKRVEIVAGLCRLGYAGKMVLSHDLCCWSDTVSPEHRAGMPDWHFGHIIKDIVPMLRGQGVTREQIDLMTKGNARRFFEQQGGY